MAFLVLKKGELMIKENFPHDAANTDISSVIEAYKDESDETLSAWIYSYEDMYLLFYDAGIDSNEIKMR